MKTSLIVAAAALMIGLATPGPPAWAGRENAEKNYKAELKECKKIANPRQKDECVRNARSTYQNRGQAESKTMTGTGKASKDKDAAIGAVQLKKKTGKASK